MSNGDSTSRQDRFRKARERMVAGQLAARGIRSERVLAAFLDVPRHLFVPKDLLSEAYDDHPAGIGEGQTISQPYIVALMTEMLDLSGSEKVLEIGTGSGYQTAILCRLAREVYTVERIATLSERAQETLRRLEYRNVSFTVGDGTLGLPQHAPYDAILVSAAGPRVPESLENQLAVGGRLVIPVGTTYSQMLTLVKRTEEGFQVEQSIPCVFVKLIGREGYEEQ